MRLLLASHNLSGMSYFGGLGRNILCNVSLSQGSKFLRPPAVSMVPWFHVFMPDGPGHVSASILRLESSSEFHGHIFVLQRQEHFAFVSLNRPPRKGKTRFFLFACPQWRCPKRISLSFSFSFSVFWSFLGCFWKPCFVKSADFQKVGNLNFF